MGQQVVNGEEYVVLAQSGKTMQFVGRVTAYSPYRAAEKVFDERDGSLTEEQSRALETAQKFEVISSEGSQVVIP